MDPPSATSGNHTADIRLDIAEALDQLPEEERTLLVLRYFEQLSYDEIAQAIDKPAGTVASGLNRARKLLREQMFLKMRINCEEVRTIVHPVKGIRPRSVEEDSQAVLDGMRRNRA